MTMSGMTTNMKKYREELSMSQQQLADKVGVRRETIVRLEKGKYNPSLRLAVDIARVFGVPVEEVFIFSPEGQSD